MAGAAHSTANPWLVRKVIGFAHQGGALEGPPSTIAAMRRARENGASALEYDIHRTADGAIVLNHDAEIASAAQRLRIAAHPLVELRALRPDLATLDEALDAFPGVPLTVEIKARDAAVAAAPALMAAAGTRPLIVTSFAPRTLSAFKRAAPGVDTAPGWPTIFGFWLVSRLRLALPVRRHVALQVPLALDQVAFVKRIPLVRRLRVTDRALVRQAHERGLAVHSWTLNDDAAMQTAVDAGADGVFTDRPSVLTGVLKRNDCYWEADGAGPT